MISDDATYTSFIHSSQVVFLCVYVRFFSLSPSIHRTVLLSESSFTPTSKTSLNISSSTPFPFSSHFSTHRHSVLRTIPYRSSLPSSLPTSFASKATKILSITAARTSRATSSSTGFDLFLFHCSPNTAVAPTTTSFGAGNARSCSRWTPPR